MSELRYPVPAGLVHSPAFSQVVSAVGTRTVYVAGQVAIDEHGNLVGGSDLEAQTMQVMRNVERALAAADATFAQVVKITTYVVDYKPSDQALIGRARAPFFRAGRPPASTLVGVATLARPEWLVEIEAIAVCD